MFTIFIFRQLDFCRGKTRQKKNNIFVPYELYRTHEKNSNANKRDTGRRIRRREHLYNNVFLQLWQRHCANVAHIKYYNSLLVCTLYSLQYVWRVSVYIYTYMCSLFSYSRRRMQTGRQTKSSCVVKSVRFDFSIHVCKVRVRVCVCVFRSVCMAVESKQTGIYMVWWGMSAN